MQPITPQAPRKAPAPPSEPIEFRSPMRQPQFLEPTIPAAPTKEPRPGIEAAGIGIIPPLRLEGVAY